jgi:ATP-dependent Lon protease
LTEVIIPERNRADLEDVPEDVREAMSFHPVIGVGEVLDLALEPAQDRALQAL